MTEFVHVGSHADTLASGVHVGPGSRVKAKDLADHDQHLVDDGVLVDLASFGDITGIVLTKADLVERAAELGIDGRSKMSADELREAVARAEAVPSQGGTGEEV